MNNNSHIRINKWINFHTTCAWSIHIFSRFALDQIIFGQFISIRKCHNFHWKKKKENQTQILRMDDGNSNEIFHAMGEWAMVQTNHLTFQAMHIWWWKKGKNNDITNVANNVDIEHNSKYVYMCLIHPNQRLEWERRANTYVYVRKKWALDTIALTGH